jgi:uncharacterized repeat protein (TIGR03803 family)
MKIARLKLTSVLIAAVLMATFNVAGLTLAAAQTETLMHNFTGSPDGSIPQRSGLLFYQSDYYGVTLEGGSSNYGTVYYLFQDSNGAWQEQLAFNFPGGSGGNYPIGTLITDAAGDFYGATIAGGSANCGVVFKLHDNLGTWEESVLHDFSGSDGCDPEGPLVFDKTGNLFGTTIIGGAYGEGAIFELSPSGGSWTNTLVHSFGQAPDGSLPYGGLIFDAAGNLYGTASNGGAHTCTGLGCGVAFQLVPGSSGWTENIMHNFQGRADGMYPNSPLTIDANGNLYGSTTYGGGLGGSAGSGTVYELSPASDGTWNETILHRFVGGTVGGAPSSPLTLDRVGNLYGETGQTNSSQGTIFRLSPKTGGGWAFKVLHTFNGTDGANPQGGLLFRTGGSLYGTTIYGGTDNSGVAFLLTP